MRTLTLRLLTALVVVTVAGCKDKPADPAATKPTTAPEPAPAPDAAAAMAQVDPAASAKADRSERFFCCQREGDTKRPTMVTEACAESQRASWDACGKVDAKRIVEIPEKPLIGQWDGEPLPDVIAWPQDGQEGSVTLLRVRMQGDETAVLEYFHTKWVALGTFDVNPARGGEVSLAETNEGKMVFRTAVNAASQDEGSADALLLGYDEKTGIVRVEKKWSGSDLDKRPPWAR